jgi:hypothetical protein
MVDTTPYNPDTPELTREVFFKCVLGSIDPYYDQFGNGLIEIPRPQSRSNYFQPGSSPMTPAFPHFPLMPLAN